MDTDVRRIEKQFLVFWPAWAILDRYDNRTGCVRKVLCKHRHRLPSSVKTKTAELLERSGDYICT